MVRRHICSSLPELLPVFEGYAGEAVFGRDLINSYLCELPFGANILEVGAGMLLLSCQLQREGFSVTANEPVGDGFSHFNRLQRIVLDLAYERGFAPAITSVGAESLDYEATFDFAFSINVMEHVNDVREVLARVLSALKPAACYFFVCPNYTFPYEPHFNLPTLGTKKLTKRILGRWLFRSPHLVDPEGTWASLNWITVSKVKSACQRIGVDPEFDKNILFVFVQRTLNDVGFMKRRGTLLQWLLRTMDKLGVTKLFALLPVSVQPAMACVICRNA